MAVRFSTHSVHRTLIKICCVWLIYPLI